MNVLIIGAGISAKSNYKLALEVGDNPCLLIDNNELSKNDNEKYYFSDKLNNIYNNFDLFVISPGVFYNDERFIFLKNNNKKIISEIEYAYQNLKVKPFIIGVTGSNGKTTIVEALYYTLKKLKYSVYKAGNIGIPFSQIITNLKDNDIVILELSNFQLDNIDKFKVNLAVISNITPNHLDHMKDYTHYVNSKLKIYQNNDKNSYLICNENLSNLITYDGLIKYVKNEKNHFVYNLNIVKEVCNILNIKNYIDVLNSFSGVKYRFQKINNYIYHDGKSTTPESTINAIKAINNQNLIVIIGGKNKGLSFDELLKTNVKKFIVYGDLANELNNQNIIKVATLKEAINYYNVIKEEDTILLYSPGCASFDQYNNYIERCEEFNKLIKEKGYV